MKRTGPFHLMDMEESLAHHRKRIKIIEGWLAKGSIEPERAERYIAKHQADIDLIEKLTS